MKSLFQDKIPKEIKNLSPILNHLTAFEATVRLGSMTLAAHEINTTVSSISRHNRIIEDLLGVNLLHRNGNKLLISDEGMLLYQAIRTSFNNLIDVVNYISEYRNNGAVKIVAPRILSHRWIIPRIEKFLVRHPDLSVNVENREDHLYNPPHISISFEADTDDSVVLCPDEVIPVASLNPKDIETNSCVRLICTTKNMNDWDKWFHRLPELQALRTTKIFIADENAALEAACRGIGAMITRRSVAGDAIKEKKLLPFGVPRDRETAFIWCTRPENRSLSKEERLIWSFLRTEAVNQGDNI